MPTNGSDTTRSRTVFTTDPDLRSLWPGPNAFIAAVVVAVVVLLVLDWLDPCTGQFTDLMGCLAAGG